MYTKFIAMHILVCLVSFISIFVQYYQLTKHWKIIEKIYYAHVEKSYAFSTICQTKNLTDLL